MIMYKYIAVKKSLNSVKKKTGLIKVEGNLRFTSEAIGPYYKPILLLSGRRSERCSPALHCRIGKDVEVAVEAVSKY